LSAIFVIAVKPASIDVTQYSSIMLRYGPWCQRSVEDNGAYTGRLGYAHRPSRSGGARHPQPTL
jgi:hypothetical protein